MKWDTMSEDSLFFLHQEEMYLSVLPLKCDHSARNRNYLTLEVFQIDGKRRVSSESEYTYDIL